MSSQARGNARDGIDGAAAMLHAIEGAIRGGEKLFSGIAILWISGNAGADGEGWFLRLGGQAFPNAIRNTRGKLFGSFGKHDSEFITAVAGGRIDGARMMAQNLTEANEGAAADEMAEAVVDGLEAVHIEQHDAEGPTRAAGAIEFGFDDGDKAAIVRETGERIADGQRTDLIEEPRLVNQSAAEHDGVARNFGEFGQEKWAIEEPLREHSPEVASGIQEGNEEERVVVERGLTVVLLAILVAAIEDIGRKSKERAGKRFPWTREEGTKLGDGSCWSGEKRGAGDVRRAGNHEEGARGFAAGLTRNREKTLDSERSEKKNAEKRAADHPAHGHVRKSELASTEQRSETEVTDRLNHAGEHEAESEDEGDTVMRATEANQSVRGVAEADQGAADLEVEVSGRAAADMGGAGEEREAQEKRQRNGVGDSGQVSAVLTEKPSDFCPIPHEIPQCPKKTGQHRKKCTSVPFCDEVNIDYK